MTDTVHFEHNLNHARDLHKRNLSIRHERDLGIAILTIRFIFFPRFIYSFLYLFLYFIFLLYVFFLLLFLFPFYFNSIFFDMRLPQAKEIATNRKEAENTIFIWIVYVYMKAIK